VEQPLLGNPKNQNRFEFTFLSKVVEERILFVKKWGKKAMPKLKIPEILINTLRLIIAR